MFYCVVDLNPYQLSCPGSSVGRAPGQLKRLQDDLRRVNTQLEQGQKEKASLDEKIGQWNLGHSN